MLVKVVNTCQLVPQADKPEKYPKVHKFFVNLLMNVVIMLHNCTLKHAENNLIFAANKTIFYLDFFNNSTIQL